ncbi:hypothetical protein BJ742DRAFT_18346 [Cladochytrium replicatum]|nr:hypothetical protein BJ742DRAFT_18346 [Cladochytrium replicatum]
MSVPPKVQDSGYGSQPSPSAPGWAHPRQEIQSEESNNEEQLAAAIAELALREAQLARERELADAELARRLQLEEAGSTSLSTPPSYRPADSFDHRSNSYIPHAGVPISHTTVSRTSFTSSRGGGSAPFYEDNPSNSYIPELPQPVANPQSTYDAYATNAYLSVVPSSPGRSRSNSQLEADEALARRLAAEMEQYSSTRSASISQTAQTLSDEELARRLANESAPLASYLPGSSRDNLQVEEDAKLAKMLSGYWHSRPDGVQMLPALEKAQQNADEELAKHYSTPTIKIPMHILELYPKVPPGIRRLVFLKISPVLSVVWVQGKNLYRMQNVRVANGDEWRLTIACGTYFTATVHHPAGSKSMSYPLIDSSSKAILTTVNHVRNNFKFSSKYQFSFLNQDYEWRITRDASLVGGFYNQPASAIGGDGVICLMQMPFKNVVASYMRGTAMLDMVDALYGEEVIRDIVVATLVVVMKLYRVWL